MISIPQNIINEIKNIVKNLFITKYNKIFDDFSNNLFFNFDLNKSVYSQLNYNKEVYSLYTDIIKESAPLIDEYFYNTSFRKKKLYVPAKSVPRSRELYFGSLYYERNYYTDKNRKNGFFLVDEIFGLEKNTQYDSLIRGIVINNSIHSNANQVSNNTLLNNGILLESLSNNSHINISRQLIYSWIKKWNIPSINYETIPANKNLYVMADEKWIHKQYKKQLKKMIKQTDKYSPEQINDFKNQLKNKHYIMSKCFILFTGAKTKNNRTELIGRHIFVTSSSSPWKDLMDEICKIYDFEKIENINLLSDAGSWILAGKDELKLYSHNNITINTCEFHVKQKINRITTDKELRELLTLDIYEYEDKKDFIKFMDSIISEKPKRKEKLTEYKNYIIKHWKSIINMKYADIKSSMESHISHYVASQFGSRPKGYSENNIEKYLKLETLKNNGFNILDLYLKSYNNSNYIYNEKELDFSLFDKSNSLLPMVTSSNPISILLHNIAYN